MKPQTNVRKMRSPDLQDATRNARAIQRSRLRRDLQRIEQRDRTQRLNKALDKWGER